MTSVVQSQAKFSSPYVRWGLGAVFVIVFWILLPPFRIVSLDESGGVPRKANERAAFEPSQFVDEFWAKTLTESLENATELSELLPVLAKNAQSARKRFGTQSGNYYFARGKGEVMEIKGRRAIIETGQQTITLLIAPPVFGNAVRDGTGLLDLNDFTGLEDFNSVSAVLNAKVEQAVMPQLKEQVLVGTSLFFAGCAKAPESVGEGPLLEFVPLRVEVVE